jgi:hypothetical protein
MRLGAQGSEYRGEVTLAFAERKIARMILRPVVRPDIAEGTREQLSEGGCGGETGMLLARAFFADRGRSESSAEERERAIRNRGIGAVRGFVLVLCFYMALGAVTLGGMMLWHLLR